ncbi:unnamed protein product [Ascophyllum nodosum]
MRTPALGWSRIRETLTWPAFNTEWQCPGTTIARNFEVGASLGISEGSQGSTILL